MNAAVPGAAPPPRVATGVALFCLAMLLFTVIDTIAKALVTGLPVLQVAWVRYVVHGALLLAVAPKRGLRRTLATPLLPWHVLRAACLVLTGVLFYLGLREVPLGASMTLVMAAPFITVLLAVAFLGERMTAGRWWALAIGFAGVLVVVRPGSGLDTWASLLPLASGACFSVMTLVSRRLNQRESLWTLLLLTPLLAALGVMPFALAAWQPVSAATLAALAAMGVFAMLGDAALLGALRMADASIVAPLQYTQLVWASLLGYVFFAEVPRAGTVAGAVLIVASGVLLLVAARRGPPPAA